MSCRMLIYLVGHMLLWPAIIITSSCNYNENAENYINDENIAAQITQGLGNAYWFSLGDSDFDSYQTDDRKYRVYENAINADNVLSPIEVQERDGRNFGQMADWGDVRRIDYSNNYSLSGATVRGNLYGWRQYFDEDALSGLKELLREIRGSFVGERRLDKAFLYGLKRLSRGQGAGAPPAIVQINIGINDIAGMYDAFTSSNSHSTWIDKRTDTIRRIVDQIREQYPHTIILLWQLLDDSRWEVQYSPEKEIWIRSHTAYWNNNLQAIAEARPGVVVFEADKLTEQWIGRKSENTNRDILIGDIRYLRDYVPKPDGREEIDNTDYIATRDGHGCTVLSALYTREIYRLLNDRFGAGITPLTPVKINTITGQYAETTFAIPTLVISAGATIDRSDLPYNIGRVIAYDSNGKDISDSAVAVSNNGGMLFGDGQNIQLRPERHGIGVHEVTVSVTDANNLVASRSMIITVR